ncbi:MAG TPA: hypothetical protein DC054_07825 [Blastocatellia bacterium]|nr:hypothetical protein [Blastocatellia bacterium]
MKTKSKVLSVLPLLIVTIAVGRTEVGNHLGRVSIYRWPIYVKQPPLEIVEMKLAKQRISSGASFSASDDWLRDLSVTVRNASQKNIKLIRLRIEFSKDAKGNTTLPDIFITGGQMFHFSPQFARTGEDLTLLPARTTDLKVSQAGCGGLPPDKKWLADPAAKLTTVSVDMVLFDDDTGWISGNPVVRDKDHPSRWVRDKSWDAVLAANLKRFAGLTSRSFAHHAEEKKCYSWDHADTGSCGGQSCSGSQVVYFLNEVSSGFPKKSRPEACVGCGTESSTDDTDTDHTCSLAD